MTATINMSATAIAVKRFELGVSLNDQSLNNNATNDAKNG